MNNLHKKTIKIVSLNHWYGKGEMKRHVLQSISMEISPGEVVLLTGPSGCGKTTLLTLIGALRQVQDGDLKVFGKQLFGASRKTRQNLRKNIGI